MDVVAHGLWTMAVASGARTKVERPISLECAIFWGVFPDIFSFAVPACVRIWWYLSGTTHALLPDGKGPQHFQYVWQLYNGSHSLLTFATVFGVAWLLMRHPVLEMLGWALHILIDIATHQGIFAIQFLWPVSRFSVQGVRWENHWFLTANYMALVVVFAWMWMRRRTVSEAHEEKRSSAAHLQ